MPRRPRVPVVVLAGGLGSGKTTLLNHLLRQGVGRIGVVVNDFGDVNVDAFLVQGQVDATATISGGCLCCLSDPSELDATLNALSAPALDLDVVIVEASGLAEPRELARLILSASAPGIRFGGVVDLLDAGLWTGGDEADDDLPVAIDHLQVASLLVVNKADLLDDAARRRLEAALERHAPGTPVVRTTFGRIDPALLFDAAEREEPTGQLSFTDLLLEESRRAHEHDSCAAGECEHAHHHFTSVSIDSPLPTDPRRLVAFLEGRPAGVYRVKGRTHVDTPGDRAQYVVQAVGGWLAFEKRTWPTGAERRTQLVAIGAGIDVEVIRAELEACLSDAGPLPADHLHVMRRYIR